MTQRERRCSPERRSAGRSAASVNELPHTLRTEPHTCTHIRRLRVTGEETWRIGARSRKFISLARRGKSLLMQSDYLSALNASGECQRWKNEIISPRISERRARQMARVGWIESYAQATRQSIPWTCDAQTAKFTYVPPPPAKLQSQVKVPESTKNW
jgi:hypothetical protein